MKSPVNLIAISTLSLLVLYILCLILCLFPYVEKQGILEVIRSAAFLHSVKLSIVTAFISTILALIIALPISYFLARVDFYGKVIIDTLIDIPLVLSPIAVGVAIVIFLKSPVGSMVEKAGFSILFEIPGLILAQFTVIVALAVRVLKNSFDAIDRRYEDVARFMGCSPGRAFFKVTLPMARNGLLSAFVICFARAIGEFGASVTVAGAIPLKTETIPIGIFLRFSSSELSQTIALMLILITISVVILLGLKLILKKEFN